MKQKVFRRVKGTLIAVFALASIAVVSVSAASNFYEYYIKVDKIDIARHTVASTKGSTHIDVFGNYMTITGSTTSTVDAWVTDTNLKYASKHVARTFNSNSGAVYSNDYGKWNHAGKTYHNFIVNSGGKINLHVTTQVKTS